MARLGNVPVAWEGAGEARTGSAPDHFVQSAFIFICSTSWRTDGRWGDRPQFSV